jgi:PEP-CTERM motif
MNARLKSSLASGAVAAAALFGAVSPAQAVVYVGNWDPAFGGIFPNLGWRGTATFSLPSACDGLTGTFLNSAAGCGGGAISILSGSVEFYNVSTPSVTLQTLNFTSPGAVTSVTLATPPTISVVPGSTQLIGVKSSFSTGVLGTIVESQTATNSYKFYLGFDGTTTSLGYTLANFGGFDCGPPPDSDESCGYSSVAPAVKFTRVTAAIPEPETYALMLAGLLAVGFAARQKQRR